MSEEKKDMTSLVEVAKREPLIVPEGEGSLLEVPPVEQVTDAEFGNLDELSRDSQQSSQAPSEMAEAAIEALPAIDATSEPLAEPEPEPMAMEVLSPLTSPDEVAAVDSVEPVETPLMPEQQGLQNETLPSEMAAPMQPEFPNEPVVEPPAQFQKAQPLSPAPEKKQDLDGVKKFGESFAIGHPRVEASPPFSVMVTLKYSEEMEKQIRDILSAEDYGVRFEEIKVQLKSGKMLIPKISEFAAVNLAQKLRELVDDIQMGLSNEIFQAKNRLESDSDFENILFEFETLDLHSEEVKDLGAEPQSERDLFTTNLSTVEGFRVTRILSAVSASKILPVEIAEESQRVKLELESEALTRDLVTKAFQLGAHGVIGLSFSLKTVELQTPDGKRKAMRLWAMGTAVRMKKVSSTPGVGSSH